MSNDIPSEPAFPIAALGQYGGLSKRELLAAMVMQGMCNDTDSSPDVDEWDMAFLAKNAVRAADALLAALAE